MLIPLGADRPSRRTPLVTYALLAVNVLAFLWQSAATKNLPDIIAGPVAGLVLEPGVSGWWTWLTYAFLHGGPMHLIGNMVFFWVFAQAVEDRLGRVGFAAFYLVGAVATGFAHALFKDNPVVGASGAVACCTGAYLVLFPLAGVRVLVFFVLIGVFVLPAWVFIALAMARDVLMLGMGSHRVAVEAHLGGYAYGFAVAFVLLALRLVPRQPYDLFTAFNQKRRRGQIRSAAERRGLHKPMASKPQKRFRPAPTQHPADGADELRRGIASALAERRPGSAATMYRRLVDGHPAEAARLPRDSQLDLANALYQREHHDLAARAYEDFLRAHPSDAEAPMVRVLLARVLAGPMDDPQRAKELLRQALLELHDPQLRALARADLDALLDPTIPEPH